MTDCPGPCNWPGDPVWCRPCAVRIRQCLPQTDYRCAVLAAIADGHRERPEDELRRSNGHAPSPSPLSDTVSLYTGVVFDWEDDYRQYLGLPAAVHFGDDHEIRSEVIAWLTEKLDGILAAPMGEHFGLEVLDWHRRLTAMAKAGTGRRRLPVTCPWCGWKTLVLVAGAGYVACANPGDPPREPPCRCRLTMDEYRAELDAMRRQVEHAG